MNDSITIALSKGWNFAPALELLDKLGLSTLPLRENSRKVLFQDPENGVTYIVLRPSDIPTYVEHGAADIGIVGKDILLEQSRDVYEPLDLKFGFCRLVVAEPQDAQQQDDPSRWIHLRVATKFPRITEQHFSRKGIHVEIIKLYGAIELAPLVGLSELIVDLVSSGQTLVENGLAEVEEIRKISARLIVNRASHKTRYDRVEEIIQGFQKAVAAIVGC